jgi:hypothetical protein
MEKIKFYKYFFKGIEKPIIMEAESKDIANNMLQQLGLNSHTNIDMSLLEDVRIEMPILGVSKKKRKGIDFVWVGKENSSDGWIERTQFEEIEKRNSRK